MTRIGLMHPGEMGASVGLVVVGNGHDVRWAGAGRSIATRTRAEAAGLADCGDVANLVRSVEVVVSLCPPAAALDVATEVAALGFNGIYVDANAVSPDTARQIADIVQHAGATFIDGDVIGGPPTQSATTRVYLSGIGAATIAELVAPYGVDLGPDPTAASALKMCYAAWTKGTWALLTAIRGAARKLDVEDALLAEWERSQPGLAERSTWAATANARKAWRFAPEMDHIAATFASVGLPAGFASAAASLYRQLDGFKDVKDPPLSEVLDAVLAPGTEP